MEGVIDHHTRALLTGLGGIDVCVTEFVRVTHTRLPEKVFKKIAPELIGNSCTPSGTPVHVQLLGSHPPAMAYNAAKAAKMGAKTIDLNFGCPAKTVNNHGGGACLLQNPQNLFDIISAVREAVPQATPVTAKVRLGFNDKSLYLENAQAAAEAGVAELAVHARSKSDGYRPPAYWEYIAHIREALDIPVIANGEIWSLDDYWRCREVSGCEHVMLGRGLMATPDLPLQIKAAIAGERYQPKSWQEILPTVEKFYFETRDKFPKKFLGNKLKQWLVYLSRSYTEAEQLFESIKKTRDSAIIESALRSSVKEP
ncbi:MAG: tRNA-dihydrouridine synthase [Cellvibrionaceae bacterium]